MWEAPEFNPSHPLYTRSPTKRTPEEIEWAIEMANGRITCIPVDYATPGLVVSLQEQYRGMSLDEFYGALKKDQSNPEYHDNYRTITKNLRENIDE